MRITFSILTGSFTAVASNGDYISLHATSGKGACKNNPSCQISTLEGPIPVGAYHANPKELSDPNMLQQINLLLRYGDWGDWNIPLYPSPATNTHGRSGFYIHGGIWEGSAGCIDIGGGFNGSSETDKLKNMIQKEIFVSIEVKI